MPGATTKYGLPTILGSDVGSTIDGTNQAQMLAIEALVDKIMPPGSIIATARPAAPTGWALCDGSSVLRAGTYAALFAAIGTTYGSVDGTHFNLPDFRGRVPVGVDGVAGRIPTGPNTLGATAGSERQTLSGSEVPTGVPIGSGSGSTVLAPGGGINPVPGDFSSWSRGSGSSHNNMPPYQVVNWLVKL